MRQRRRERQWHREDLQAFEENLRLPIGAEEEDFDFLGIRWMQDGRWGQDHPAINYMPWVTAEMMSIYQFYGIDEIYYGDGSLKRKREEKDEEMENQLKKLHF
ncbi:hypothetical protein PV326_014038 [Microctonus aethiopoides]|nr:hypothetical protein PV326_014038 [Microctonus aethiopoides]